MGSRAGPGATSSGPSAGGIGSSVFRTARRSARAGFMVAVGVMVVVSHAARNPRPNKPMISFMIKMQMPPGRLLSLPLYRRVWQDLARGPNFPDTLQGLHRTEDRPLASPAVIDRRYRNLNRLEACLPDRPEARLPYAASERIVCFLIRSAQ